MSKMLIIAPALALLATTAFAAAPFIKVDESKEPMATGKFQPTWESLEHYQTPDWYRDAKFGIWAHWGPQCQPEDGDWYAREMYIEGTGAYKDHLARYGPPSKEGFKDIIHLWKAENWDPEKLVALYKRAGAQYFFALANHHDNFDLWNSKYQPWNSTQMGPQKDIIAGWAAAARHNGLRFGVSVHAAHAWSWYEVAQGSDKTGPFAGVPYDGKLTKADGLNTWWQGFNPQDLYCQNHIPSPNFQAKDLIHSRWNWNNGVSLPDQAYCDKFYNRTLDLINQYHPDLLYFDDTALPLWPISDAGLKIAAHFYNDNITRHNGNLEAVLFGKILNEHQRHAMVWDIERGQSNRIEPLTWQTDTCIGDWHYNRARFTHHYYRPARDIIRHLADVVSKNGNLLLNIPVRGDGTIDDDELHIVQGIADWMDINKEAIFATRPWKVCGEGPALDKPAPLHAQGFNEGTTHLTPDDIRYTATPDGKTLYAISLGRPTSPLTLKRLGTSATLLDHPIATIHLLGSDKSVDFTRSADALTIQPTLTSPMTDSDATAAVVYKITRAD